MTRVHVIGHDHIHHVWDRALPPALVIEPGDTVRFECRDGSDGQITPGCSAADAERVDRSRVHALTGPVAVAGARPGDVLVVDVLGFEHKGWGYTCIRPGRGLLPDDFGQTHIHHWQVVRDGATGLEHVEFRGLPGTGGSWRPGQPAVRIPLAPFCGIIGVAPAEPGPHRTGPPHRGGGNMDVRHLTAGSRLLLPVQVEGALFSAGDCHLAQGDGEVCITAIEAPMAVTLRFDLQRGRSIPEPQFEVPGPLLAGVDGGGWFATTATDPDLLTAARNALRHMLDHLGASFGFSRPEAYMLCSVAADLKISQAVNEPVYTVSAYLPKAIFAAH